MPTSDFRALLHFLLRATLGLGLLLAVACHTGPSVTSLTNQAPREATDQCGNGRLDEGEACDPGVNWDEGCPKGWGMCWQCSPGCQGWNQLHYPADNYSAIFDSQPPPLDPLVTRPPACISRDPRSGVQSSTFDDKGHILYKTVGGRPFSEYTWNESGSILSQKHHYQDGLHQSSYRYDAAGHLIELDRDGPTGRFIERNELDEEGHVVGEYFGTSPEEVKRIIERKYGQHKQLLAEDRTIDEGNWHQKRWNVDGRIMEIRGLETSAGIVKWQGDVRFHYDAQGRIVERLEDGKVAQSVRYQDSGDGTTQEIIVVRNRYETRWILRKGVVRKKTFSAPYPSGRGSYLANEFSFDEHGRLVESKQPGIGLETAMGAETQLPYSITRYTYGPFGLLEKQQRHAASGKINRSYWRYDASGHLLESHQPGILSIRTYRYDTRGRLLEEKSRLGAKLGYAEEKSFAWDQEGRLVDSGIHYNDGYPWLRGAQRAVDASEDYSCHSNRFAVMPRRGYVEKKARTTPSVAEQITCLVTRTPRVHWPQCQEYPKTRPAESVGHPIHNWNRLGQAIPDYSY